MGGIKSFYDLEVWQEAHKLTLEIYRLIKSFPDEERYALASQVRRCSSSVGANIAEGFGRYHHKDKIKFFYNARGSLVETQNFLFLAQDLKYIEKNQARKLFSDYENLAKRINGLIKSIGKKPMTDDQ